MAADVFLPKTGIYVDDVTFLQWLIPEGGHVQEGQPILIMETEKIEVEVEAEATGWVHHTVQPEATLPIGTVVGLIAETQDEYSQLAAGAGGPT